MSEDQKVIQSAQQCEQEQKDVFLFSDDEYKKFERRRLEFSNALIGSFDAKGGYKITPEILKEFVEMPKVIREIRDNRYYAIANSNMGSMFSVKFSIVVEATDEENRSSMLCLLDDVVNPDTGTYHLMSTLIATYRDSNDEDYVIRMKKALNLITNEEQVDGGLYDANKFPNFYAAKMKKIKLKGQLDVHGEEIDEMYVKEMIAALKKMGPYGAWVLKNFMRQQALMGDKFPKKGTKGYFKMYARLLDQAIMNAKDFPLTPEQRAILNRIQQKRADGMIFATTEIVQKSTQKQSSQKSSANKESGEQSKPSGGKKKADKKPAKKSVKNAKKKKKIFGSGSKTNTSPREVLENPTPEKPAPKNPTPENPTVDNKEKKPWDDIDEMIKEEIEKIEEITKNNVKDKTDLTLGSLNEKECGEYVENKGESIIFDAEKQKKREDGGKGL